MSAWITWYGGKCPVGRDFDGVVTVRFRDNGEMIVNECYPHDMRWSHNDNPGDIVAYKLEPAEQPATPTKKTAQAILRTAADLIEARGAQRDQPNGEKSMANTVAAFNAIYGTQLTEVQGWHFMELLKMVRSAYGQYVADDYEDKVAYAALAAEAAEA